MFSRVKWALVTRWFAPGRTISAKPIAEINDLGVWARVKHGLARRWLKEIEIHPDDVVNVEHGRGAGGEFSTVMELIGYSTPVAMADGDPRGAVEMAANSAQRRMGRARASSQSSSGSGRRSGFGSSVVRGQSPVASEGMVEEENDTAAQENLYEYDEWEKGRREAEEKAERKRQRVLNPTGMDVSTLLAIPSSR